MYVYFYLSDAETLYGFLSAGTGKCTCGIAYFPTDQDAENKSYCVQGLEVGQVEAR
jgi:hypothetical protein